TVSYVLRKPAQTLTIEIVDPKGTVVRSFTGGGAPAAPAGGGAGGRGGGGGGRGGGGAGPGIASFSTGLNSVAWDLRYPSATSFPNMILWGGGVQGPMAAPGTY